MRILSKALSKWFVPKDLHENLLASAKDQIEKGRRIAEARNLLTIKVNHLGTLLLGGDFSVDDTETDGFYDRLEARITNLRERVSKKDALVEGAIADLKSAILDLGTERGILKDEISDLKAEESNYVEALRLSQEEVAELREENRYLRSRYTERYVQAAEIIIDVKQKLDELTTLNKV